MLSYRPIIYMPDPFERDLNIVIGAIVESTFHPGEIVFKDDLGPVTNATMLVRLGGWLEKLSGQSDIVNKARNISPQLVIGESIEIPSYVERYIKTHVKALL